MPGRAVAASGSGPTKGRPEHDEGFLLAKTAGGDLDAFRQLVDSHLDRAVRLATRILGDAAAAEDVAQEAMLRLWRSAGQVDETRGGLRPWLSRVVVNLAIDSRRSGAKLITVEALPEVAEAPLQEVSIARQDASRRVEAALALLPERQRQALVLFHYEEWSQGEIAAAMGLSTDAVESLIARGRRALKESLRDEWRGLLEDSER